MKKPDFVRSRASRLIDGYRVSVAGAGPVCVEWLGIVDGEPVPLAADPRALSGRATGAGHYL